MKQKERDDKILKLIEFCYEIIVPTGIFSIIGVPTYIFMDHQDILLYVLIPSVPLCILSAIILCFAYNNKGIIGLRIQEKILKDEIEAGSNNIEELNKKLRTIREKIEKHYAE